jgi:N-acylglucosamine 2-epimerase
MINQDIVLKQHQKFYLEELKKVLTFWQDFGYDKVNRGFYTYLDEKGEIYCEDKSVWAQGRGAYIFAKAYKHIQQNPEWLAIAKNTYSFLQEKAFFSKDKMYFKLTKEGLPLQNRRYWFSEAFYIMASIALYEATNNQEYLLEARRIYDVVYEKYSGIVKTEPKFDLDNYQLVDLSSSMIFLSLAQMMLESDGTYHDKYIKHVQVAKANILGKHYHEELKALLENIQKDGSFENSSKGRLVNPGHSLECAWFLLDTDNVDEAELKQIINIAIWSYELGWDRERGGLRYFVDILNKPLEQLEYDLKLWWPHSEALIIFLKLYLKTNKKLFFDIYQKVFKFTKENFIIDDLEWIGYLRYDNTPLNYSKGNLFKGPFHIPRMLMMNYLDISDYLKGKEKEKF